MTTTRVANTMSTPIKQPIEPPRRDLKRQETWLGGRSSLDVPRMPSLWDDPGGRSQWSQQTPTVPNTPTPDSQISDLLSRQRPLSTGPSSLQQHLSVPSTQYSRSQSNSFISTPHSFTPAPPASASLTSSAKPSWSPSVTLTEQGRLLTGPSKPGGCQSAFVPERPMYKVDSSQTVTNGGFKRIIPLPSPVNRADKPKISDNPSSNGRLSGSTSLEPSEKSNHNRLSPFSTPPSSEGTPDAEIPREMQVTGLVSTKVTNASIQESYFLPPPRHHSSDDKLQGYAGGSLRGGRQTDPRLNGFSRGEQPPSLPPRRDSRYIPKTPADRLEKVQSSQRREDYMYKHKTPTSASNTATCNSHSSTDLLPPPKRSSVLHKDSPPSDASFDTARKPEPRLVTASIDRQQHVLQAHIRPVNIREVEQLDWGNDGAATSATDYPDISQSNRRPPRARGGIQQIDTKYDTRLFDICGRYVCASGYLTRAWDVVSGDLILNLSPGEKEIKVTSMAFKPGATAEEEGLQIWLGTNYGDIQEIDIPSQNIVQTRSGAHARREIIKLYRYQNSMWSLDDDGNLLVWIPDGRGLPSLKDSPVIHRVSKGYSFSIIIKDHLWLATGKELRIFNPSASEDVAFHVLQHPLKQHGTGEITSGAVISSQLQKVYFGHTDGKVTIYSTTEFTCLGVINVSVYRISSLAGAGFYLWAGYNTGMIYVYDTRTQPWLVKKDWHAHDNPIAGILADRSSVWKLGRLQVASIGLDNSIKIWDGMLEEDWLGELGRDWMDVLVC